jgi:hypothetical protein
MKDGKVQPCDQFPPATHHPGHFGAAPNALLEVFAARTVGIIVNY